MQFAYSVFLLFIISTLTSTTVFAKDLNDSTTVTTSVEKEDESPTPDKINFKLGGVLRFTYNYSDWKESQQKRGGDFGYDVFGLTANATYNDFFLSAEYRFYSDAFGGSFLKNGWMGYNLSEENNLQLGLTQVPFGITKYNSNSFFFSLACYAGFEDDYDMGLKYTHTGEKWEYSLAFFKNAEDYTLGNNNDASSSRYAYDLGSIDTDGDGTLEYRNKEINQLNGQVFYNIKNPLFHHRLGASVQYSGMYNIDTEDIGSHYAYALHYEMNVKGFNVMAQALSYNYNAEAPTGEDESLVAVGAYGAPYLMASEAQIYTLGVSYTMPVDWGPVSSVKLYNDYGLMKKNDTETMTFYDTQQNVTGVAISAGPIYAWVDYAMGKNHSWLGEEWTNALATGSADAEWSKRFNINIGYYF